MFVLLKAKFQRRN